MDNFLEIAIVGIIFFAIIGVMLAIWVNRAKPSKEVFSGNPNWKYLLYFLGLKNWRNGVEPDIVPQFEDYFFRSNCMAIFMGTFSLCYLVFKTLAVTFGIYKAIGVF